MRLLLFLIIIFDSCTKAPPEPVCYYCVFGTIKVGAFNSSPIPETHCEPGAKNYKKYLTVPGTIIQNWSYATSCKAVK